jgi:hypothetical protein
MEEMTTTSPTLIEEIENFLRTITHRTLVETSEVQDFLLDLRGLAESMENADLN